MLPGGTSAPFRSLKSSRKPRFIASLAISLLATAWWCAVAVLAHLLIKPKLRRSYEDDLLSVFGLYYNLFKGLSVEEFGAASSALFTLLAAVAGLALVLRGMVWELHDLPDDSRMRRAWLQRVMDASVREDAAKFLMVMLCGLYGFIVACYGLLVAGKGWKGFGPVIFLILVVLSLIVSVLPAFVVRSDVGEISNYAYLLVCLANLVECRCLIEKGVPSSFEVKDGGVCRRSFRVVRAFISVGFEGWKSYVGRYSGVGFALLMSIALTVFRRSLFGLSVYLFFVALLLEFMIVFALYVNADSIAAGGSSFKRSALFLFFMFPSSLWWVTYVTLFIGVMRWWGIVVAVLPMWWSVRFFLAFFVKFSAKKSAVEDAGWLKSRFRKARACLERGSGLCSTMAVCVDQCVLESRKLLNSCADRSVQIATELNAVFDEVVPKGCVVSRGDGGEVDLRNYLSETVKVTVPPVPDTGSCTGKQGEWERTPLARIALCR